MDLPEQIIHHTLEPEQLVCSCCGKFRPELSFQEQSQEIGWEVRLVRRCHVRARYGPSCQCPQGRGIRTAPKPAKLIAKGLLAVDFWVEVLLKKFEFQQPLQRTIREVVAHGMHISPGTLSGGLKKIKDMVDPLAGQFVLHCRQGTHWHMDETRWPMFCLLQGKDRQLWWFLVVVSPDVTVFPMDTKLGWMAKSGGFLQSATDGFGKRRGGNQLPDFRRDFLQGDLSRLQFLADCCNVNLSKPICERGMAIEEDFQVARVFQIADQGGVGDHTL